MARADLILSLVKASRKGDDRQVRKVVEALAAEERAKNHTIFADRLLAQLRNDGGGQFKQSAQLAKRSGAGPLVAETVPTRCIEEMILPIEAEETVRELVAEQHRADLLRSYNLEPRNRVLLVGPPGNGKTTLAEAMAYALSLPLLLVRYEAVIGSYLGETAQRISHLFEHAGSRRCVLFFDEFDSVGKERGDLHETGEIKRVVSSLLLQIDALPSYVVAVAATNHPELLDRAVWRRFQVRLELPAPSTAQIEAWFRGFEKRHGIRLGISTRGLATRLAGMSFGEVEDFGLDVLRSVAMARPDSDVKGIVTRRLQHWGKRFIPEQVDPTTDAK